MSAYSKAYRALVAGGMPAPEAAALLADFRRELGEELAAGLLARSAEKYGAKPTDSHSVNRRRTARYGAAKDAAAWVTAATITSRLTTTPQQRDNRSTT